MFQYQERKASRIQPAGGPRPPPVDPCQPIFTHVSLQSSSTPGCQDGPAAAPSNGAELSRGRLTPVTPALASKSLGCLVYCNSAASGQAFLARHKRH